MHLPVLAPNADAVSVRIYGEDDHSDHALQGHDDGWWHGEVPIHVGQRYRFVVRRGEDEFERIFIITHIDELKDAFPARIEVIKTAKGSNARIV